MIQKLFKSSFFTFANQLMVAVIGFVLTPYLVQNLGDARYGLFALLIMLLGVSGLLDMGLSKGIVKFVAARRHDENPQELNRVVWISLYVQLFIGALFCTILLCSAGSINRLIAANGGAEITSPVIIWVVAFTLPVVLISGTLRGVLEGLMAFKLVNGIKFFTNVSIFVVPFLLCIAGYRSISLIALVLAATRLLSLLLYGYCCLRKLPFLAQRVPLERQLFRHEIIAFSGWVAITNFMVPIVGQIDKFIITRFLGISFVTYYTLPNDIVNGLWILPSSILIVLFPALAEVVADRSRLTNYYGFAVKVLLFCMCAISLVFFVLAFPIMALWQNAEIAGRSFQVLQIIAIVIPLTAASWIASNTLLAAGRSKYLAFNLGAQLLLYLPLSYLLTKFYGIAGAATAVAIRMAVEAALYFFWSRTLVNAGSGFFGRTLFLPLAIYLGLLVAGRILTTYSFAAQVLVLLGLLGGLATSYMVFVFTTEERNSLKLLTLRFRS